MLSDKQSIYILIPVYYCVFFQRYPTDKAYFIAKEILATERTYLKDLEVITVVRVFNFLNAFPFLNRFVTGNLENLGISSR